MKLYYKSLPLVKGLRAIAYGTLVLIPLYCLYQRLDLSLVPLLRQAKIYWIDVASLSISLVLAIYAERWLESPRLEEGAELFFYLVLVNICWKYAQNKQCAWAASRLDKAEKL